MPLIFIIIIWISLNHHPILYGMGVIIGYLQEMIGFTQVQRLDQESSIRIEKEMMSETLISFPSCHGPGAEPP